MRAPMVSPPQPPRELAYVSLAELSDDETFRLRQPGEISSLAQSIAQVGQLFPIEVREKDGALQPLTGFRRLRALRLLHRNRVLIRSHGQVPDEVAALIAAADGIDSRSLEVEELRELHERYAAMGWSTPALQELIARAIERATNRLEDLAAQLRGEAPPDRSIVDEDALDDDDEDGAIITLDALTKVGPPGTAPVAPAADVDLAGGPARDAALGHPAVADRDAAADRAAGADQPTAADAAAAADRAAGADQPTGADSAAAADRAARADQPSAADSAAAADRDADRDAGADRGAGSDRDAVAGRGVASDHAAAADSGAGSAGPTPAPHSPAAAAQPLLPSGAQGVKPSAEAAPLPRPPAEAPLAPPLGGDWVVGADAPQPALPLEMTVDGLARDMAERLSEITQDFSTLVDHWVEVPSDLRGILSDQLLYYSRLGSWLNRPSGEDK